MPTYITLAFWRQQGIENFKNSPSRLDPGKEAARAMGVEIKESYLVTGQYDFVFAIGVPDDETVGKLASGLETVSSMTSCYDQAFNYLARIPRCEKRCYCFHQW